MIYDIIAFTIIILCIAGIIVIVVRKFPQIANIDVDTIQEEKDFLIKNELIKKRLKRVLSEKQKIVSGFLLPAFKRISGRLMENYGKLKRTYHEIQESELSDDEAGSIDQKKDFTEEEQWLNKGWAAISNENFKDAEGFFIKVLEKDPKILEAYNGLASVYVSEKDYEKAKETLIYLLKLVDSQNEKIPGSDIAKYHFMLGNVFKEEEDYVLTVEHFKKASDYDPNNPKYLDHLIEIHILKKDISVAREYLLKLKMVNPENQKIKDLEERIYSINKSY